MSDAVTKCPIARLDDLDAGSMRRVEPNGVPICLVRLLNGDVHAISDICSHEDVELSEGELDGTDVECPEHGSRFDVRTGAVGGLPANTDVPVYAVTVEDGQVYVEL